MKKAILSLILVTSIVLSACNNTDDNHNGMIIMPSKFSEETQEVLKIFDDEVVFLDYTIDETVKSSSINLWFYKNGEWTEGGKTSGNVDSLENQIAIRLKENGYDLFAIDKNGHIKYSYPEIGTDFSNSTAIASTRISSPTQITLNEEIPLWIKLGTDKSGIDIGMSDDFRNSDCNAGVAITVTFSDKEIE